AWTCLTGCSAVLRTRCGRGAHYQRWRRLGDPACTPPEADKQCTVVGCTRVTNARGLCGPHYYRLQTYGDPEATPIRRTGMLPTFPARVCPTCGGAFDPGTSRVRKYCGRKCAPKRPGGSVNRRSVVERIGARDGWVCHLCKEPVDRQLYWPNVRAGSVDHVVAVSRGGSDEESNLALSHLTCNVSRGNIPIETCNSHHVLLKRG